MRLIFFGPPGSGKGTQAQLLSQRLGLAHISTGDILREAVRQDTPEGRLAKPYMSAGRLVPDSVVNEIVCSLFRKKDRPAHFVMDGYPRTIDQAEQFDEVLHEQGLALDGVLSLKVDDEELIRRLSGRGREDDSVDTVRKRLQIFHSLYQGLLDYYRKNGLLVEVPGSGEKEAVHQRLLQALDGKVKSS
ncbi:MAG: adenylate kinase [Gemmataceae bacterium]|nr:adenylate kinase [Gemmataceae bacterium]MCI0739634.1 adenylate kinase [Gemmataceae bacterium]